MTDAEAPTAPERDVMPEVIPRRWDGVPPAPLKVLLLVALPLAELGGTRPCVVPGCATEMTEAVCANGSDDSPYWSIAGETENAEVDGERSWSRKREPPPRDAAPEVTEEGAAVVADTRGVCCEADPARRRARARETAPVGGGRWLDALASVARVSVVTPSAQLSKLAGPGMLV